MSFLSQDGLLDPLVPFRAIILNTVKFHMKIQICFTKEIRSGNLGYYWFCNDLGQVTSSWVGVQPSC